MARISDSSTNGGGHTRLPADPRVAAAKLRTALLLFDSGVAMKRAQLHRQDPEASEETISRRVSTWLRTRPGALRGDAEGPAGALADPS